MIPTLAKGFVVLFLVSLALPMLDLETMLYPQPFSQWNWPCFVIALPTHLVG